MQWFKVWTSILIKMEHLTDEQLGKWTRLGARIRLAGTNGVTKFQGDEALIKFFRLKSVKDVEEFLKTVPNISVKRLENRNGKIPVTWTVKMEKWAKYQTDTTGALRAQKSRSRKKEEKDKIRGEESRKIIARYSELFKVHYKTNPLVLPKEAGMIGNLIDKIGFDALNLAIENFFKSNDKWIIEKKHSLNILSSQLPSLITPKKEKDYSKGTW
jgi:hypothetical protein